MPMRSIPLGRDISLQIQLQVLFVPGLPPLELRILAQCKASDQASLRWESQKQNACIDVQPVDAGGTGPDPAASVGGHGFQGNGFSSVAQTRNCPTSLSHCARELPKATTSRLGSPANRSHRN